MTEPERGREAGRGQAVAAARGAPEETTTARLDEMIHLSQSLRGPLATLVTFATASERWLKATPSNLNEANDAITGALEATKGVSAGLAQVQQLSRTAARQMSLACLDHLLVEALAEATRRNARRAPQLTLVLELGDDRIRCDPDLLRYAIIALLTPAIRVASFRPDGGVLLRTGRRAGDGFVIIEDASPRTQAMPAFFMMCDVAKKDDFATCRSIMAAHAGRIEFDEGSDENQAQVKLLLPLATSVDVAAR